MSLQSLKLLVFCFCFVKQNLSTPVNYVKEFAKIRKQMEVAGVVDTVERENYLLQLYVDEKFAHMKTNSENMAQTKLLRALAVRSRMETLADELWQDDIKRPYHVIVQAAFEKILRSNEKKYLESNRVQTFRKQFIESGLDINDFLETCQTLYGMISDHKLGPFINLPDYDDIKAIKEVLATAGMVGDESKVLALQVFLKPLPKLTTPSPPRQNE